MRSPHRLPWRCPSAAPGRLLVRGSVVLTALIAAAGLLLLRQGSAGAEPDGAPTFAAVEPGEGFAMQGALQPGHVLVLASWQCSFPQLDRVNEVALDIVEAPLTTLVEGGQVLGWGQLNGRFRDDFNYHTYYITQSVEDYRQALSRVLTHMSQERPEAMAEFYRLCSNTRETLVTVVTARP